MKRGKISPDPGGSQWCHPPRTLVYLTDPANPCSMANGMSVMQASAVPVPGQV